MIETILGWFNIVPHDPPRKGWTTRHNRMRYRLAELDEREREWLNQVFGLR